MWSQFLHYWFNMFGLATYQYKIFKSIIVSYAIDVMDYFLRQEKSTEMFFHYKTVFKNVMSTFMCIWMVVGNNPNIPIPIFTFSAFPIWMIYSFEFRHKESIALL